MVWSACLQLPTRGALASLMGARLTQRRDWHVQGLVIASPHISDNKLLASACLLKL